MSESLEQDIPRGPIKAFFVAGAVDPLSPLSDRDRGQEKEFLSLNCFVTSSDVSTVTAPTPASVPRPPSPTSDPPVAVVSGALFERSFRGRVIRVVPCRLPPEILPPETWIFCFPSGISLRRERDGVPPPVVFSFVLTNILAERKFMTCLVVHERLSPSALASVDPKELPPTDGPLCVPRCYALLSTQPCLAFSRAWLREYAGAVLLEQNSDARQANESMLFSLFQSLPEHPVALPAAGASATLRIPVPRVPPRHGFAFPDSCLWATFGKLGPAATISIFSWILRSERTIFVADQATTLSLACEAFTSVLWPLRWPDVIVSVLCQSAIGTIHSPSPFIIGVLRSTFSLLKKTAHPQDVLVVDLDSGSMTGWTPPKVPLPEPEVRALDSDLRAAFRKIEDRDSVAWDPWKSPSRDQLETFQQESLASFARFFASLLQRHRDFMLVVRTNPRPQFHLLRENFVAMIPHRSEWLHRFTEGHLFRFFAENRPFPLGDAFDAIIRCEISSMTLVDAGGLLRVLSERDSADIARPKPVLVASLSETAPSTSIQHSSKLTGVFVLDSVQFRPMVPVPAEVSEFARASSVNLLTYNIGPTSLRKLRENVVSEQFRRLLLTCMTEDLSSPSPQSGRVSPISSHLAYQPGDIQKPWMLSPEALKCLPEFMHYFSLQAIAQSEFLTASGAVLLCQRTRCGSTLLIDSVAKTGSSDQWANHDFWRTFQAVVMQNQLVKIGNSISDSLEGSRGVLVERGLMRTSFLVAAKTMEMLGLPPDFAKKLIPDGLEESERQRLEQAQAAPVDEDEPAPTVLPPHLAAANSIVCWVDDTIGLAINQLTLTEVSKAAAKERITVAVIPFFTTTALRDWLSLYGKLAAPKLRIVTNSSRRFDGGEFAAQKVIACVREVGMTRVPVMIYSSKPVWIALQGTQLIYSTTYTGDFINFCVRGKPLNQKP